MTARLDANDKPCGCGRTHTAAQWAALEMVGTQPDYAGGHLELRNCHCGSTLSVPVLVPVQDHDTAAGRVIDASAPWVRRLTAVVVRGTEPMTLAHPKGEDPAEWPEDLRVREWPEVTP